MQTSSGYDIIKKHPDQHPKITEIEVFVKISEEIPPSPLGNLLLYFSSLGDQEKLSISPFLYLIPMSETFKTTCPGVNKVIVIIRVKFFSFSEFNVFDELTIQN